MGMLTSWSQCSRVAGQAVDPHALLLQLAQAARQVGHPHHRHAVRRAGRGLAHGGVDLHRLVLRDHHRGRARRRRAAQAGAQVVRILHAVEHQQQGLAAGILHEAGEIVLAPGLSGRVACHRALVAQSAGDAVQCLLRHAAHVDVATPGVALDLGDPRVAGARLQQHLAHVAGVVLDRGGDSVDAGDPVVVLAHPASPVGAPHGRDHTTQTDASRPWAAPALISISSCRAWPACRAAPVPSAHRRAARRPRPGGSRSCAPPGWP
jgi:hypothetical protein